MNKRVANPMICKSGAPLRWRAIEVDGQWFAELGLTGVLSGKLRWERVGIAKNDKAEAEALAISFATVRAGRL